MASPGQLKFSRRPVPVNQPGSYAGMVETYTDWTDQLPLDGYLYDEELYYLPYRYDPYALQGSFAMRKANLVRFKNWIVPVSTLLIAAYDTYEVQLPMLEGARIWAIRYMQFESAQGGTEIPPTGAQIQLTDACSGVPFFQDFVDLSMFSAYTGVTGRRIGVGNGLLTQPRIITGQGQLNVEIANTTGNALYCQVVMSVAEQCMIVQTPEGKRVSSGGPISSGGRRVAGGR